MAKFDGEKNCLLFLQSQNFVQKTMSSIFYYFTTFMMSMLVSCKTLVLYTFAKILELRDYFTSNGNGKMLLTEEQSADKSNNSLLKIVVAKTQKQVEKLYVSTIFTSVKEILMSVLLLPVYILPHLIPSHIANLMSIAEATIKDEDLETEEVTILKKATYFMHDIYNLNGKTSNGSTKISDENCQENGMPEDHGEISEEITYVKRLIRNFVEIFVWTRKTVSRFFSRSTRVALSAPKTLVLLLVPSILTQHNINAETINGVTPFPHGKIRGKSPLESWVTTFLPRLTVTLNLCPIYLKLLVHVL